jgi:hypothetical protein
VIRCLRRRQRYLRLFTDGGTVAYAVGNANQASKLCLDAREPHQVGTQTEAGALACSQADAGGQEVQEGERHRRHDGHSQDLLHIQLLLGDDEGRQRHGQTLQEILDRASHELSHSKAVHLIFRAPKICCNAVKCARLKPGVY